MSTVAHLGSPRMARGKTTDVSSISRGLFGANVGLDRLLEFFERHGIKGTFNIPSHTLESFPKQMAKVRDAEHEMCVA